MPLTEPLDARVAWLLGQTRLRIDPRPFVVVRVPSAYEASLRGVLADIYAPFFVQVFPHEQSIVLPADEWARLRARFPGAQEEAGYRFLTLDAARDWDVTGYLAAVTAALAGARIPAGPLSSFHHDHLIVRDVHMTDAVRVLENLISDSRVAAGCAPDGA